MSDSLKFRDALPMLPMLLGCPASRAPLAALQSCQTRLQHSMDTSGVRKILQCQHSCSQHSQQQIRNLDPL